MTRLAHAGRLAEGAEPERVECAELERIAAERMTKSRMQVLLDHPHFASALLSVPMRASSSAELAAAIATDGRRIVYRSDAIASRSTPEVALLVQHVLLHVVLAHPVRGRGRQWGAWELACDHAVNAMLRNAGVALPPGWPWKAAYERMSAEAIYESLVASNEKVPGHGVQEEGTGGAAGDAMFVPAAGPEPVSTGSGSDERDAFERAAAGMPRLSDVELGQLGAEFAATVRRRGWGSRPGGAIDEIDAATHEQIDWRRVLARFVRHGHERSTSTLRPNRRHLWRGIWLPGVESQGTGRIAVAVDTSGSMDRASLGRMLAEIDAIRRCGADELSVMQFDAAIQGVAEFSPWQEADVTFGTPSRMTLLGRGGTDLRLPFDWAARERAAGRPPTALVICTDGRGPVPAASPAWLPVLFVLTEDHGQIDGALGQQFVLREGAIAR